MINLKSAREIEIMRKSCQLAANALVYIEKQLKVGMSTLEVNDLCHKYIIDRGAYPSPLKYHGFPKSICTSLNDVICHGIPSEEDILQDGDILNIDITAKLNGFHGDTNKTFLIGQVAPEIEKLVKVTRECLDAGISVARPGGFLGDIGAVIQEMAEDQGYTVVREYCGHGIGREFHEEPQVLHYGKKGTGVELRPGMTFTIEPMINLGKRDCLLLDDDWTVVTKDGKASAQFEHTIHITDSGAEILTLPTQTAE
jgi:methionyl aminopeptidase